MRKRLFGKTYFQDVEKVRKEAEKLFNEGKYENALKM